MNLSFRNKRISGILTILPGKEIYFEDEMENYNFSTAQSLKLKTVMGFNKRRVVPDGVCASDLCIHGLDYLFKSGMLNKEDVDALILVTQTPDHIMPPTSNIIQGHFGLKHDMICMDINQGCAGYVLGLMQAFMLLEQSSINKVVLLNADVLSPKVSKKDRNSNPLIGDAASVTVVEKGKDNGEICCSVKMNGAGAFSLQIPAGGARMPINPETGVLVEDAAGNFRSKEHLIMKGDEVFNFVQKEIPPMIEDLMKTVGITVNDVDYFMFHQPNRFMLQKLADKIGVSRDKMPSNIVENFGNSSGCTIPTAITFNLGNRLTQESFLMCLSGFGVGLAWASMIIRLEHLQFCEMIDM